MNKELNTVERTGTIIKRKDGNGDNMVIRGSCKKSAMFPEGGFLVSDQNDEFPAILPFNKISEWEIIS